MQEEFCKRIGSSPLIGGQDHFVDRSGTLPAVAELEKIQFCDGVTRLHFDLFAAIHIKGDLFGGDLKLHFHPHAAGEPVGNRVAASYGFLVAIILLEFHDLMFHKAQR